MFEEGQLYSPVTQHADGRVEDMPGKANVRLNAGDLVTVESCGGGGYGPPAATGT